MFSLDTGAPPPDEEEGCSSSPPPTANAGASSSSRRTSTASDGSVSSAASVVSMIGAALRDSIRRSSTSSDVQGETDLSSADGASRHKPLYMIGGTRSRENSQSSIGSDELPDSNINSTLSDSKADAGTDVSATSRIELKASLRDVRLNCMDVATKLVQFSSELRAAMAESVGSTSTLLQEHTGSLADHASVVSAAIKAARDQGTNHQVIRDKLVELQELADKVALLKRIALQIETEAADFQNMGDPKVEEGGAAAVPARAIVDSVRR